MIFHFFEVWLLIVMTFIVGCVLGALLYGVLADSRLAIAQGALADGVGDVLDAFKARVGMGRARRPSQTGAVAPPMPLPARELPNGQANEEPRLPDFFADEEPIDDEMLEVPVFDDDLPDDGFFEDDVLEDEPAMRALPAPVARSRPEPIARLVPRTTPLQLSHSEPPREESEPEPQPRPDTEPEQVLTGGDPDRVASAEQVAADGVVPMRPAGLSVPRAGVPDNLTRVRGIGQRNEALLNSLGIYHFSQIASWTPGEVRWIGQYLAFPERIERDDWVGQAVRLASGTETGFMKSAERRRERRRRERMERAAREASERGTEAVAAELAQMEEGPADDGFVDPGDALAAEVQAARSRPLGDDWPVDEADEDFPIPDPSDELPEALASGEEDDEDDEPPDQPA